MKLNLSIGSVVAIGLTVLTVAIVWRRESKTWSVEVENLTESQVAVIGLNDHGEGTGFGFVQAGEKRKVKVGAGDRPDEIQVLFEAFVGDDGYPTMTSTGFLIACSFDAAKAVEPLTASRRQRLGCEEQ